MANDADDSDARSRGLVDALVGAGFPRPLAILFSAAMVAVVLATVALVVWLPIALLTGGYGP